NHGDIAFYCTVAKNLAAGRGFVIDYIWNFWDRPAGIPTPSNVWWMPLPSALCALGMAVGGSSYAAAQLTMIAVSSVLPLLAWLLGRELFADGRVALLGAALCAGFHLFLDKPCAPLSHGPYLVLATLSLWLIVRSARTGRGCGLAGAAIAATQLARSDGILLLVPLVVAHLARGSLGGGSLARGNLAGGIRVPQGRLPWRRLLLVPLGYAAVMAPWWAHNLAVHGALMPGGSFRAVFMREYEQWYSLPESVTAATWLADGWGPVLALKASVAWTNLGAAATGLVSGATDRVGAFEHPALTTLLALSWVGLLVMFRRGFAAFWALLAAEWTFYSLVFTAVGIESFRTALFSVYPVLLLAAAAGLLLLADRACALLPPRRTREPLASALAALVAGAILCGQVAYAAQALDRRAEGVRELTAFHEVLSKVVAQRCGDPASVVLMARDVHELHALTGLRCVQIPYEPERVVREVARRYGVTHLLLLGAPGEPTLRPALEHLELNPHYELVEGPSRAFGRTFRIYRLLD
ncbi:MAG TPA: glycosyltransferase family 39 protein, partial [Planctomycetota bacterium]|nr:glycosyltransferase family 39 protein [Planctomycetota bacterium]